MNAYTQRLLKDYAHDMHYELLQYNERTAQDIIDNRHYFSFDVYLPIDAIVENIYDELYDELYMKNYE